MPLTREYRETVVARIKRDTFKELARQTGLGEKTLHRMLHRNGNPTTRNLGVIVKRIAEVLARIFHTVSRRKNPGYGKTALKV